MFKQDKIALFNTHGSMVAKEEREEQEVIEVDAIADGRLLDLLMYTRARGWSLGYRCGAYFPLLRSNATSMKKTIFLFMLTATLRLQPLKTSIIQYVLFLFASELEMYRNTLNQKIVPLKSEAVLVEGLDQPAHDVSTNKFARLCTS